jgi:hypothetical protein
MIVVLPAQVKFKEGDSVRGGRAKTYKKQSDKAEAGRIPGFYQGKANKSQADSTRVSTQTIRTGRPALSNSTLPRCRN